MVTQLVTGTLILMISLLTVIILIDIVSAMLALSPPRAAYSICIIQIWFAHRAFSASYCVYQVGAEYALLLGFCLEVQQMILTRKKQLPFD
jgi:hypothetical protein